MIHLQTLYLLLSDLVSEFHATSLHLMDTLAAASGARSYPQSDVEVSLDIIRHQTFEIELVSPCLELLVALFFMSILPIADATTA